MIIDNRIKDPSAVFDEATEYDENYYLFELLKNYLNSGSELVEKYNAYCRGSCTGCVIAMKDLQYLCNIYNYINHQDNYKYIFGNILGRLRSVNRKPKLSKSVVNILPLLVNLEQMYKLLFMTTARAPSLLSNLYARRSPWEP